MNLYTACIFCVAASFCLLADLFDRVTKVIQVLGYPESLGFQADLAYLVYLEELSTELEWKL